MRPALLLCLLSACRSDPSAATTPSQPALGPSAPAAAPGAGLSPDAAASDERAAAPPSAPPARVPGAPASCSGMGGPLARALEPWPERALPDLARHLVEGGGFNTSGRVAHHFVPVPCPPGATCKPQPPAHVVLADLTSPDRTLVLATPSPRDLPHGAVVRASVVICGGPNPTYGETVNRGELRAWARVP